MQIDSQYLSVSSINQQLAQKRAELSAVDKKEQLESFKNDRFEKNPIEQDEQDYKRVLEKFKTLDSQTRAHEQLHASLGDTIGAINYNYQVGPDGKLYATGGHVRMDVSIPDDPKAAQAKLDKLSNAASAPSELSAADASIANVANLNKMLLQSQPEEAF